MSTLEPFPQPKTTSSAGVSRLGLIAGEGQLPLHVAKNAHIQGIEVVPFMMDQGNRKALQSVCNHSGYQCTPGLLRRTLGALQKEEITHLVFAGKVNKWIILRDPRLDDLAIEALKKVAKVNDDAVMLWLINGLKEYGIEVLPQTDFLQNLMLPEQCLSQKKPSPEDIRDIHYGFEMAKEMGRLDIGQTIVVHQGMVIAVEAIEGTDECLKRAGKLAGKKGGTVVKVAKPEQDQRFDVPTVGLRTLKTMHKAGLKVLAAEAGHTLFLDPAEMTQYANQTGMVILATTPESVAQYAPG